jgi:NADPH2:quinone reductase
VMRTRELPERTELVERARRDLLPLFESGALRPIVARRYWMEDVSEAHREMERGEAFGKIVLEWEVPAGDATRRVPGSA